MADYQYITDTGVVVPDTSELLSEVVAEWRSAISPDLVVDNETPQGVMIVQEVDARDAVVRNNAAVANQINPDIAEGVFFDAIWSLTGGSRREATHSALYAVNCLGVAGTIIPKNSRASTVGSNIVFASVAPILIAANGIGVGNFAAVEFGPLAAPVNTLTQILDNVLGWESVSNPKAAALGQLRESSAAARRRRRQTLAIQGSGTPMAVKSRLADRMGVLSHTFRENVKGFTQVIDGITLVEHSIWACVDGGSDLDVATALLEAKGGGSDWNGKVSVSVVEPVSKQAYVVLFDRPLEIFLSVRVTARFANVDGQSIIPNAVLQYARGELDGEEGLIVGAAASPWEFAGAINRVEPRIVVLRIELSTDNGTTWASNTIDAAINQVVRVDASRITVIAA